MKKSYYIFAFFALLIFAFGVWRLAICPVVFPSFAQFRAKQAVEKSFLDGAKTAEQENPYANLSVDELWRRKPPMRKSEGYPPKTDAQVAMWQWWRAMRQMDKKFEHKTPIEFYGKVIDQFDLPVVGAVVNLQWSIIGGTDNRTMQTGPDGSFSIIGIRGKRLGVYVYKEGYLTGLQGQGSYEYGGFYEHNFHVADSSKPVVFRLWKMGQSEPMYKWLPSADLSVDGKAASVDVKSGRLGSSGDVSFSVLRDEQPGSRLSGYTITVQAAIGGGIAVSNGEEYMFQAPAGGYRPFIQIVQKAGSAEFQVSQTLRFYLKTSDGKYAAVEAEIAQFNDPAAGLQALIYYNPSGSRNLEFDDKKQINR